MLCPVCQTVELHILDKQGIEIDYCPRCRGIWLDRGELEKLIAREAAYTQRERDTPSDAISVARPTQPRKREEIVDLDAEMLELDRDRRTQRDDDDDDDRPRTRHDARSTQQPAKKKGFLGDLFDIFD